MFTINTVYTYTVYVLDAVWLDASLHCQNRLSKYTVKIDCLNTLSKYTVKIYCLNTLSKYTV